MTINSNQFHSGPAGALTACELELVQLYAQLAVANLEYAQANIAIDSSMGGAASQANISAGDAQAAATTAQACQYATEAAVTVGTAVATKVGTSADTETVGNKTNDLTSVQKFNDTLQNTPESPNIEVESTGPEQGEPDTVTKQREAAVKQRREAAVKQRREELKNPNKIGKSEVPVGGRNDEFKTTEELNQETIKSMKPDERADCIKRTQKTISDKNTEINSLHSHIQSTQTRYQQYGQIVTATANSVGTGIQAHYQAKQGVAQGLVSISQNNAQMAGSMLGTVEKANGDWYGMIASTLQTLRAAGSAYTG